MKRLAALVGIAVLIAAIVALVVRWKGERQYRQLLADGEQALAAGQTYVAIESLSGAIALRPDSMAAYYRRGEAYRQQHQDDKAVRDLREAARLAPEAPQPLVALGQYYDDRGEWARAAEWYGQAAVRLKDADPALLYSLALSLYRSGSPAAAREPLRRALNRDDSLARAHYLLGLVYRDAHELDPAVVALERAIRLSPDLVGAREELADLYRARGQTAEEMTELQTLARLDEQVDREIALAYADVRRGEYDAALAVLGTAGAAFPGNSRVILAMGRVLLARAEETGDRAMVLRALSALEQALGGTARRSEGLALYGRALYLKGDTSVAERILLEASTTTPVDLEAFAYLADAAERLGHAAIARDALLDLDALQGDTVSAEVRSPRARRIGELAIAAGDPKAAIVALTHAVDAGIADARTLGLLARARWQTGDVQGARRALGQALAIDERNSDLKRLQEMIR